MADLNKDELLKDLSEMVKDWKNSKEKKKEGTTQIPVPEKKEDEKKEDEKKEKDKENQIGFFDWLFG